MPYYDNDEFTEKIGHLLRNHVKVIFTTQVSHEGSDMELYRVGFRIKKKYELLEAYTMTTEAVVAKVEWRWRTPPTTRSSESSFSPPSATTGCKGATPCIRSVSLPVWRA